MSFLKVQCSMEWYLLKMWERKQSAGLFMMPKDDQTRVHRGISGNSFNKWGYQGPHSGTWIAHWHIEISLYMPLHSYVCMPLSSYSQNKDKSQKRKGENAAIIQLITNCSLISCFIWIPKWNYILKIFTDVKDLKASFAYYLTLKITLKKFIGLCATQ